MQVDTCHFARGPVWRAEDVLRRQGQGKENEWQHQGEYLVMYKVPKQAIVNETVMWRARRESGPGAGRKGSRTGTGCGAGFGAIGSGRP